VLKEAFEGLNDSVPMDEIAMMVDPQPSHRTPPEVIGGIPYIGVGDIDYKGKKILYSFGSKGVPSLIRRTQE